MRSKTPPDRAIVLIKANPFAPSKGDFETMARRRFQDPRPRKEGRWWVLYYRQDEFKQGERSRPKKRQKLAPIDTPEREVKRIAAEFLRSMNQGLQSIGAATGFEEYVYAAYIPVVLPQMARSTTSLFERYQDPPQAAFWRHEFSGDYVIDG